MISLIVFLLVVGVLLYFISQIPMDPAILQLIRVVVILCVVLYLIQAFGVLDYPLPRLHK